MKTPYPTHPRSFTQEQCNPVGCAPLKIFPLPDAVENINKGLCELHSHLSRLEEKLQYVSEFSIEKDEKCPAPESRGLVDQLSRHINSISEANIRVQNILDRLQF